MGWDREIEGCNIPHGVFRQGLDCCDERNKSTRGLFYIA